MPAGRNGKPPDLNTDTGQRFAGRRVANCPLDRPPRRGHAGEVGAVNGIGRICSTVLLSLESRHLSRHDSETLEGDRFAAKSKCRTTIHRDTANLESSLAIRDGPRVLE